MTQLADYRTSVRARGYDSVSDALVDDAIAEARRRVASDHRWSFLQTLGTTLSTTANVSVVAMASVTSLLHVEAIRLSLSGEPLNMDWKPLQELRNLQFDYPDASGQPLFWSRRGSTLLLWPTPDAVYTVNLQYVTDPGVLAPATDDVIPTSHKDLVVWAAIVPLAFRQRDFNASNAADSHYRNTLLPRLVAQDTTEQRQTSRQVKSGFWD